MNSGGVDMSDVTKHIGSRIRLYRKLLGLTIDDLADGIHKSKSTVSKYETGSVSIDAETLFDIAGILRVPVSKLVDYDTGRVDRSGSASSPKGFFNSPGKYYMYHLSNSGKILKSVVQFHFPVSERDDFSVELYNDLADYENLQRCRFYYSGTVSFSDLYTNMVFSNQINVSEKAFVIAGNPLNNSDITLGLVTGISNAFLVPISYKSLFSRGPLEDDDLILDMLRLTKENISDIKKRNMLVLANSLHSLREMEKDL